MILMCVCGRRFRTQTDSETKNRTCPQCGAALVPESEALVPAVDINVLIEQMKVLRDELVARDRQLRKSQAETTVLKAELDQLRSRLGGGLGRELPSNRVPLFTSRDP